MVLTLLHLLVQRLILHVDHGILGRLSTSYGLSGKAYTWLESYITGRAQIIPVGNRHSPPSTVLYGVHPSPVLGPVLYVLYTSDVAKFVEVVGLGAHFYGNISSIWPLLTFQIF